MFGLFAFRCRLQVSRPKAWVDARLWKAVRGGDQGSIRMGRAAISDRRCAEDDRDMTDVPGSLSLVFSTSPTLILTASTQAGCVAFN